MLTRVCLFACLLVGQAKKLWVDDFHEIWGIRMTREETIKCWKVTVVAIPLPSNRHHRSTGDCLEGSRKKLSGLFCAVLCEQCNAHTSTDLTVL